MSSSLGQEMTYYFGTPLCRKQYTTGFVAKFQDSCVCVGQEHALIVHKMRWLWLVGRAYTMRHLAYPCEPDEASFIMARLKSSFVFSFESFTIARGPMCTTGNRCAPPGAVRI